MSESPDSLDRILRSAGKPSKPEPEVESAIADDVDALSIADMNGRYSTMRPANKNLTRLHVMLKDGSVQSFQYAYLDARSTYNGKEFVLVFAGLKHYQITVRGHGKGFWRVYDYLTQHRWPYIREEHRDLVSSEFDTAFTSIEVKDITPRPEA